MNSDLMMGGILKQTDRANLFTIFGEPDLTIERTPDGQIVVELRELDIYDPTRGQIRSSSVDDIACWFIDTAYDETSFFVRHAYFLGNDSAYDSLKRALRAEVDESGVVGAVQRTEYALRPPRRRSHRRQGDQSLWRRGVKGVWDVNATCSCTHVHQI